MVSQQIPNLQIMYPKIGYCTHFFGITDHNLGPVSLQVAPVASSMIFGTSQRTQEVKAMGLG